MRRNAAVVAAVVAAEAAIAVAAIVIAVFGLVGYWLIGRRARSVDFLIATEGEMKKVNWSTRREVVGSTIIVLIISFFMSPKKARQRPYDLFAGMVRMC